MSSQAMDWLSVEFLEKVLKNSKRDESIKVKHVATKPATAIGDNYLSDMIRASVEYSRKETDRRVTERKSLIIKIAPFVDGLDKDLVQGLRAFDTEIEMMENTLVKMHDILNEKDYRFNARVLHTQSGDPSLLVIEDLAPLGFRMAERQSGLNLQHCVLAMRRLAKFHAASVALREKEPKSMVTYNRGLFYENNPEQFKKFFKDALRVVGNEVVNWTELGSDRHIYSKKLIKLSEVCYEKATGCSNLKDTEFNVMNHGDFWVNNMLFRYDEAGNVIDHIFVDFQLPLWSSPAVDILYFLNTSLAEDVDLHHRVNLVQEYLNTLTSTMTEFRCKTKSPSMADLQKSMKERDFLAVIASCLVMPFILVDKSESQSLDEILQKGNDYVNPAYKGKAYRRRMLKRLPAWNARGLIDV